MVEDNVPWDYFEISEIKLDDSFPNAPIGDRDKYGGGLIEFASNGLIRKTLRKHEPWNIEVICYEVTISNKSGSSLLYDEIHGKINIWQKWKYGIFLRIVAQIQIFSFSYLRSVNIL